MLSWKRLGRQRWVQVSAGLLAAEYLRFTFNATRFVIEPADSYARVDANMPIIMAIFGGMGTVLGPVVGAVALEIVNDLTWLHLGRLNMTIFGIILIVLVFWLPEGLVVRLKEAGLLRKTRSL